MLKMTRSPNKLAPSRNNDSRSASSKNDNSRPASRRNNSNSEVDGFDGNDVEYAKKLEESKSQKSAKSQKLSKSQKLAKLEKKSSKSGNSLHFGAKKAGPSFLIPGAKQVFNCLRLAFTEAPIFWHYNPECQI